MADCSPIDPTCLVGSAVSSVAGDALSAVARAVTDAVGTAVKSLGTVWVSIATPDLTGEGVSGWVQGALSTFTGALLVLSILVGGARMFWERRAAPGKDLLRSLLTFVVVNGAALAAIALLAAAGDEFSTWILARSTAGTDFGANVTGLLALASLSGLGLILVILLGLVAIAASLVQIVLMIARGGLLVVMGGALPTAAAFTNTEVGRTWFRRCTAWIVALLMYKPAAAIVYATAFRLVGAHLFGTEGLIQVITGLVMMVLALFALPALVKFVTPMVAALATSGGGAAGATAGAGVAALATGAQIVSLRGSGSSGTPPPPAATTPGPSGAGPTGGGVGGGPGGGPGGGGGQVLPFRGGPGPSGGAGSAGGASAPGAAGPAAGSAAGAGGASGAAGGAAAAGAAGGPAGAAAGAAVQAGQAAAGAVRGLGAQATGGPTGATDTGTGSGSDATNGSGT